ncbi:MAG: hypothetical protein ACI4HQ_09210 [Acetatifactor sp.]
MQLGGISGNHGMDSHQVTNCMHDHAHMNKKIGGAAGTFEMSAGAFQLQQQKQETELSLTDMIQKLLGGGKSLLKGLGGSNLTVTESEMNPYFLTLGDNSSASHMPLLQRTRTRVKGVVGRLAEKFRGRSFQFQSKNSFRTKSEQKPGEDLRRRSKYKKDELEIDCILTDESYLLDSYDRKGEYSQLTTQK